MTGPRSFTRFTRSIGLAVLLAGAAAPVVNGQCPKITASDASATDLFGYSVSISDQLAIVGTIVESAYVFARDQGGPHAWGEVRKLTTFDPSGGFGRSVSINGDIAVVGAPYADGGSNNMGFAYVFARDQGGADNWGQIIQLNGGDDGNDGGDNFGWSVSISGDNVVVGTPRNDVYDIDGEKEFSSSGAVFVYNRNAGGQDDWDQSALLTASDQASDDEFGISVAISSDVLVVGSYLDDDAGSESGSAYVFLNTFGQNWEEVAKLTASDASAGDQFGFAVSVSGDLVVVGARRDNDNAGSAYVFARDQGGPDNWGQVQKLAASDAAAGDFFGASVSISGDRAVIGANFDNPEGSAYLFARDQGGPDTWGQVKKLTAFDGGGSADFGNAVSIDGDVVLVAAYADDDDGVDSGSVYRFDQGRHVPSSAYPTIQVALDASCPGDTIILDDPLYTGPGNVNLDFGGKPLTLRSAGGDPTQCVIDCEGAPDTRGITFFDAPFGTVVEGITVRNGNAIQGGGMLVAGGSDVTLSDIIFDSNTAPGEGGGLFVSGDGSIVSVSGGVFTGNHANGGGAAIIAFDAETTFTGTVFVDNTSNFAGAAILHQDPSGSSSVTLVNCLFQGNESLDPGRETVAHQFDGTMNVINCTFAGNPGTPTLGLGTFESSTTVVNSIFWDNAPPQIVHSSFGTTTVSYSDVQGGWGGAGSDNIDSDPLFVDAPGGDLQLLPGSPCRDAGDNVQVPSGVSVDLNGDDRIIDGACSLDSDFCPASVPNPGLAERVDMGAFEGDFWQDAGIGPNEFDCNDDLIPDHCNAACALAAVGQITDPILSQDFRAPGGYTTYQSILAAYGRPWAPNTGQDPNAVEDPNDPGNDDYEDEPARLLLDIALDGICDPSINEILREVADMQMLLGNEGFSDALDPTVGEGDGTDTIDLNQFGTFYAFQGVVNSPIDEELALLRGREISLPFDDAVDYPPYGGFRAAIYNRLPPNAAGGDSDGNLAYRSAYGGLSGGITDNLDAALAYPQGHGDAYGYYLGAIKAFVTSFNDQDFAAYLITRQPTEDSEDIESDSLGTIAMPYRSVREMAGAMAARARAASAIVDLTFRYDYQESAVDPSAFIAEYDPDDASAPDAAVPAQRAWRMADWASRAGLGAYLDWALVNHLIPARDPNAVDDTGLDPTDANRQDIDEIDQLTGAVMEMQARVDRAAAGNNPMGLAPNSVPFGIDPDALAGFIDDLNDDGDHYQQVRVPAVQALTNAGHVLAWANEANQRMRAAAESNADFGQWAIDAEIDFNNRLIELFGLPSPTDPADNDLNGVLDEDDDEAGVTPGVPGGPDLVNFILDDEEMAAAAQAAGVPFTPRTAPGEMQLARSELKIAELALRKALASLTALNQNIAHLAEDIEQRRANNQEAVRIIWDAGNQEMDLVERQRQLKLAELETDGWDIGLGILGDVVGSAAFCFADISAAQCAGKLVASGVSSAIGAANEERKKMSEREKLAAGGEDDEFDIAREQTRINTWRDAELAGIEGDNAVMDMKRELQALIRQSPQMMIEIATAREQVKQSAGRLAVAFQRGQQLLADRERMRKLARDELEAYRWKDLAFRVFRNDALQKYRGARDVAAQYVMLAARSYAYEYNRSETDTLLADLHRERQLGASTFGGGLWGIINTLDGDWNVESVWVESPEVIRSLRHNLLGINPDTNDQEANLAFRAWLESRIVQKLEETTEMAHFAGPLSSQTDFGPGLVIRLATQISPAYNFFGKPSFAGSPYGGAPDFDATYQTYMMLKYEVLFENAQLEVLAGKATDKLTMWVLPVGDSVFRDDSSNVPGCAVLECMRIRPWAVVNQRLRKPSELLPGGTWETNAAWGAWVDTANAGGQFFNDLQLFASSFGVDTLESDPLVPPITDRAGHTLWNTNWFMAVPGAQWRPGADADEIRQCLLALIYGSAQPPDIEDGCYPNPPNGDPLTGITDIKWVIRSYRRQGF